MAKPWSEVANSDAYKALAPDQQDAARGQYFDQVVAPQVPKDQLDAARSQFDAQTGPKGEKPLTQEQYDKESFWQKMGGPKPGEKPSEWKSKVESVDSPFPDILPGGSAMANAVAREGGGIAGAAKAIGRGAVNLGKDALNTVGAPVKYLLRGSESNLPAMRQNIATFQQAGAQPSVGQATQGRVSQTLESLLSKTPGGAGRMAAKAGEQQADLGKKVGEVADSFAQDSTPFTAGRAIDTGLKGFVKRLKDTSGDLYGKVDQYVPPQTTVDASNTAKALASMNQSIEGAEHLSKFFKNGKIQDIERALKADTSSRPGVMVVPHNPLAAATGADKGGYNVPIPGGSPKNELPYEAMKKLRTLVGQELENTSLVADVPRSKWKALYAALSGDLEGAAKATGNPDAIKAMDRANAYTKAGYDRIDAVLDKVQSRGIPEDIYKAATNESDMTAGATKIASVMKSLQPEERDVVRSAFIRRMGTANAGAQNDAGDVFSSQTFLTRWNRMSPQAKAVMFSGGENNELRQSLDAVAQSASKIKEGSKVFANPSGTAPAAAQMGLAGAAGAAGVAAMTGNAAPAAALMTGLAGANISARMMTSPKFVSWLAAASKLPDQQLALRMPGLVNLLRTRVNDESDDVKQDVDNYIGSLKTNAAPQPVPAAP